MKPVEIAFSLPDTVLPGADFGDTFQIVVEGQNLDALAAAERAVHSAPSWINRLLQLRTIIVRPLGLKPGISPVIADAGADNIGIFPILSQIADEVVLGMDDRHLDFRLVIKVVETGTCRQIITASTVVKTHNALGRAYLALVKPFHKIIVPAMMAQIPIDKKAAAA
ncbi:MAG: DUF2867 domain-containing protein [Notoacmeibacter sp.]